MSKKNKKSNLDNSKCIDASCNESENPDENTTGTECKNCSKKNNNFNSFK